MVLSGFDDRFAALYVPLGSPLKCINDPLVDRHRTRASGIGHGFMEIGAHSQGNISGIRLFRLHCALVTIVEIVVHAITERLDETGRRIRFKGHNIANTDKSTVEDHVVFVEFDGSGISPVRSHGLTPAWSRNSRMRRTTYRLASGVGCGRWMNNVLPFIVNRTRDPLPSETSQPTATRRFSISRHLIVPLTGFLKTA